jgi:hypothetical protein
MDKQTEYGIKCQREDEKELVKNINNFLQKEYGYRKMYKRNDDSISKFNYEYCYFQFIREKPLWYFDLYPNEDLDGKLKFDNKETQWVLFINKIDIEKNTSKKREELELFFQKLLCAIDFETILLHDYKKNEERIGNDTDEEFDEM